MGATSVTGVGLGVASNLKGPGNNRDYFVPRNGPHIVLTGSATVGGGGSIAVTLPAPLTGGGASYMVMVSDRGAVAGATSYVKAADDGHGDFTEMTLYGTAAHVLDYVVLTVGMGLEVNVGFHP
jgi:hypothetical protein